MRKGKAESDIRSTAVHPSQNPSASNSALLWRTNLY